MAYVPIEDLLPKANFSIYKLVRLVSKRALELADDKPKLIEAPINQKSTTTAFHEIIAGKVFLKEVSDQFKTEAVVVPAVSSSEDKEVEEDVVV